MIIGGVSSTQTIQSSTLQAFLASKCAAILLYLRTWLVSHFLNAFNLVLQLSTNFLIELKDWPRFTSADITIEASPSITTSLSPRSLANAIPSSAAVSSASNVPSGKEIFLHIAPISSPFSFLITTPTPDYPASLNTASSMLTLNHPHFGGHHVGLLCPLVLWLVSLWWLFWRNSSTKLAATLAIVLANLRLPSCFARFPFFQTPQVVVANSS